MRAYLFTILGRNSRNAILLTFLLLGGVSLVSTVQAQNFTLTTYYTNRSIPVGTTGQALFDFLNTTNHVEQVYLTLGGPDASAFTLSRRIVRLGSGGTNDSLKEGGMNVEFYPISYKVHHAFVIATDSNGTRDSIPLTGNGIGQWFRIYAQGMNDSVPVGQRACHDIVIVNSDQKIPQTITGISLGTTDSSTWNSHFFTIDDSKLKFPVTVNPGDSIKFTWCFAPLTNGYYFADSIILHYTSLVGVDQTEYSYLDGRSAFATAPDSECIVITGTSHDTLDFGTLAAGTGKGLEVTLTNPLYESFIDSISIEGPDKAYFSFYPQNPLPIALYYSKESVKILTNFYTTGGDGNRTFEATATFFTTLHDGGITSCARTLVLRAKTAFIPPPDTTTLYLASDSTQMLNLVDTAGDGCKLFRVTNNTDTTIKIDTLFLKSGRYFQIVLPSDTSYPIHLARGQSFYVDICLIDSSMPDYVDTLVVIPEYSLTALNFVVHATHKAQHQAVMMSKAEGLSLMASPNPSNGNVKFTFTGIHQAEIQITDLLGRVVAKVQGVNSEFEWKGSEGSAKGVYIARVTGRNDQGQSVTMSNRVVIVK